MTRFQSTYTINPGDGFVGDIARPNEPLAIVRGRLSVPTTGTPRRPRPGDALFWNSSSDNWILPTSDAQALAATGILSYRASAVANANQTIDFGNGDEVEIAQLGVIWLTAQGAIEPESMIVWNRANNAWAALARVATVAAQPSMMVTALGSETIATGTVFQGRICGRVA